MRRSALVVICYLQYSEVRVYGKNFVLTMLYLRGTFLVYCLLSPVLGSSSKKGLCIPPGDNFHCGDLAAFTNVRYE